MDTSTKIIIFIVVGIAVFLIGFLYGKYRKRKESGRYTAPKGEKLNVSLDSKDLERTAEELLEGLGGKDNVTSVKADGTRLKIEIIQYAGVNETKLRESGVGGVIRPQKTMVHIIIGDQASEVADEINSKLEK